MPRRPCAILALLGALAVLTGCAGDTPVTDRDAVLHLKLDEYRIRPQAIRVRAGVLRIIARNEGRLTHNVRVEESTDTEAATPLVYATTPTAFPGRTVASKRFRLLPGTYRLVCSIGNHENLGQYAELVVTR